MDVISTREDLENICWEAKQKHLKNLNGEIVEGSPTLYHYTPMASAIEILQKSSLHFVDIRYSNDPLELIDGLDILKKSHHDFFKDSPDNDSFHIFMNLIMSSLDVSLTLRDIDFMSSNSGIKFLMEKIKRENDSIPENMEDIFPSESVFVSCLSEKNDDLRQWIPYADEGKGVAIGFKGISKTHEICECDILKVSYQKKPDKQNYALSMYREIKEIYWRCTPELRFPLLISLVLNSCKEDIIASKSYNYKDEEEWRMIACKDIKTIEETNFKYSKDLVKPYINIPINKDSIVEIVLGPKCDMTANVHALKLLLKKHGYPNTKIRKSEIKFR